jgi:DNA-binding HxlR family transcriptional regulator
MKARIESDEQGRRRAQNPCTEPCPIERGMRIIGGKWTGSLLWHLKDEPVRFNDLSRMVGGASKKMISTRLRQMEGHGLIQRRVIDSSPVSVEYSITPEGLAAIGFLDQLRVWSEGLEK